MKPNWGTIAAYPQAGTDNGFWRALRKEQWRMRHPNLARLERVVHRVERRIQG